MFWIVDNGSSHRGQASIDWLQTAWPNARLLHTPVHASWLNQIGIYFSILQRHVLTRGQGLRLLRSSWGVDRPNCRNGRSQFKHMVDQRDFFLFC